MHIIFLLEERKQSGMKMHNDQHCPRAHPKGAATDLIRLLPLAGDKPLI